MEFEDLLGKECDFYGANCNEFQLGYQGEIYTFEVLEDENDGYRSYFDSVITKDPDGIFFKNPIARVLVTDNATSRADGGYALVDVDKSHVWLVFGTDYSYDYYPMFVFDYEPKPSKENEMSLKNYTDEELQEELESRSRVKNLRDPKPRSYVNWEPLYTSVVENVRFLAANRFNRENHELIIYEAAVEAVYGKDVWEWLNKLKK